MLNAVALREKVRKANALVKEYQEKQLRFDALKQASTESTSTTEKATILLWIDNASKWLTHNKQDYERALVLIKIPESDLEQLDACDRAIYGG